jgi:GNAT superfamily N-acetyltransferase
MKIVRATAEDIPAIMELIEASVRHMESKGIQQWDHIYPSRSVIQSDIESGTLFLAREKQRILGIMVINEHQEPQYHDVAWSIPGDKILVVHRLSVDPLYQRKGIAGRLMEFAEQQAEIQGYQAIRLDAFTENPPALAFYVHRGYRKAGTVLFRKGWFFCFEKELSKLSKN